MFLGGCCCLTSLSMTYVRGQTIPSFHKWNHIRSAIQRDAKKLRNGLTETSWCSEADVKFCAFMQSLVFLYCIFCIDGVILCDSTSWGPSVQPESSFAGKDVGVPVYDKLNLNQQRALAAMKANCMPCYISKSIGSNWGKWSLPSVRYLWGCIWSSESPYTRERLRNWGESSGGVPRMVRSWSALLRRGIGSAELWGF